MPWCPNCKNEYREGITKCADCGTPLVAELSLADDGETLCYIDNEAVVDKLVSYLDYSGIKAVSEFDAEEESFRISVKPKDIKKALIEYKGFLLVEASRAKEAMAKTFSAEEATDEVENEGAENGLPSPKDINTETLKDLSSLKDTPLSDRDKEALMEMAGEYKPAGVYQSQSDKASDLYSTGYTFLIIGIAMLIFTALNFFGVLKYFTENYITLVVLTALSLAACGVGIGAFMRSKKARSQVDAETKLTDEVKEWLENNLSIMTEGDLSGDDGTSDEILYLNRTAAMKRAMYEKFGNLNEDFADTMIDEFYNSHF